MIKVWHVQFTELDDSEALALLMGSDDARSRLAAQLLERGLYEPVAELDLPGTPAQLEHAYAVTQNGVVSPSWSRMPPAGLRPIGSLDRRADGGGFGRRSSMVGDVLEVREVDGHGEVVRHYVVATSGLSPLPSISSVR